MIKYDYGDFRNTQRTKLKIWKTAGKVHSWLIKTFPKGLNATVRYSDMFTELDVTISPKNKYKFSDNEVLKIQEWMTKIGRWEDKIGYQGKIEQQLKTKMFNLDIIITVESNNAPNCKVVVVNSRRERSYSYQHKVERKLVCV